MSEALALPAKTGAMQSGGAVKAIIPQSLEDCFRLGNMIHVAKMAPESLDTAEKVTIALLHGLEVGLAPMMALQSIAVINGKPTLWGDGALGLVRATGQLEEFEESIDGTGDKMNAVCRMKRRGEKAITHSFTVSDAIKAGLWNKKGPWTTYPRRMLAMRPRSWCLRDTFADVLKGLRIAEEVMDTDMKDVTPPIPPPAPRPPSPPQAQIEQQEPEAPAAEPEEAGEFGAPEAYAAGEDDYEKGLTLGDMPTHIKQFPELAEAYQAGWESKQPGAGE